MSSITCSACGESNRAGARFCRKCRQEFINPHPVQAAGLQTGQVMANGKYIVERTLGRGGMGTVYLARQMMEKMHRHVVVKEMLDYYDVSDEDDTRRAHERFEAEAATLSRLNIKGVPQIFDYFTEGGHNYIVMQYIEGRNLEEGLTRKDDTDNLISGVPCPSEDVRAWGIELCDILDGLAKENVVHMDIKPANLIVGKDGEVWLVDFGTAKAQRVVQPGGSVGMQKSSVFGTKGYAPPEQYKGIAEPRSDVYALASTMYHLLTDTHPGDHTPFTFPNLSSLPPDIEAALQQALVSEIEQRVTAAQLRGLLTVKTGGGSLFTWRDGTQSKSPQEFAQAADRRWEEAKAYLYQGRLKRWLEDDLKRFDLPGNIDSILRTHKDQDIGLEKVLRILDPGLPAPSFTISPTDVQMGTLSPEDVRSIVVQINNSGRGCLYITLDAPANWIEASETTVKLLPQGSAQITAKVIAKRIPLYTRATGVITAADISGGSEQINVEAEIPKWRAFLYRMAPKLDWAAVAGLGLGAILCLLYYLAVWLAGWSEWRLIGALCLLGAVAGVLWVEGFSGSVLVASGVGLIIGGWAGSLFGSGFQNDASLSWVYDGGILFGAAAGVLVGAWITGAPSKRRGFYIGLFGAGAGALVGFAAGRIASAVAAWLGSPVPMLVIGATIGLLLGVGYQIVRKPARWPRQGLFALVALPLMTVACLAATTIWAINEGPKVYHYYQASVAYAARDYPTAWQEYQLVYDAAPNYQDVFSKLLASVYSNGETCLDNLDWSCAEGAFAYVIKLEPGYGDVQELYIEARADPVYREGIKQLTQEAWEEAAQAFEEVIAIDPGYKNVQQRYIEARAEPHYRVGKAHLAAQEWEKARSEFRLVMAIDPGYKDTAELLLQAQVEEDYLTGKEHLEEGRWEQAILSFDSVSAQVPDYKDVKELRQAAVDSSKKELYDLGVEYGKAGDWEKAAQSFASLRVYDPAYPGLQEQTQNLEARLALRDYYAGLWRSEPVKQHTAITPGGPFTSMALSPHKNWLATGDRAGRIQIWDPETGKRLFPLDGHSGGVNALAFSSLCRPGENENPGVCANILASGGEDGVARIWDLDSKTELISMTLHSDAVTFLAFNSDSTQLATLDRGAGIRLWQIVWDQSKAVFLYLLGEFSTVTRFDIDAVGNTLASVLDGEAIRVFDASRGKLLATIEAPTKLSEQAIFAPNETILTAMAESGEIYLWDVSDPIAANDGRIEFTHRTPANRSTLVYYPGGLYLIAVDESGALSGWEIPALLQAGSDGAIRADWTNDFPPSTSIKSAAFGADGWLLATLSQDGKVILYTIEPP